MQTMPTKSELQKLTDFRAPWCVSIYLTLSERNAATNPSRIALKNIMRSTETRLRRAGADERTVRKTLRPARRLLDSYEFWSLQHGSVVILLNRTLSRVFHVPELLPERLQIRDRFDLVPLESVLTDNADYLVLALSHQHVQLYAGDHFRLRPVRLKSFPTDMKSTLRIDELPQVRQTHAIAPARGRKGSEAQHGQYNVAETDKVMLKEFFRRIDRRLHPYLQRHGRPLILAGVSYLLPMYRQVNTYPRLIADGIAGNMDRVASDVVRAKAWQLMKQEVLS